MRKRKIKRKGKSILLKVITPLVLLLVIFFSLYFFIPSFINKNVVSPIAVVVSKSDTWVIEDELYKKNISYSSIKIASDSSYLVVLSNGTNVIFTPKKDMSEQISSLQLMLNRLTIEGKRIKLIDFRFDRPVIRL